MTLAGVVCILRDITARKRMEDELRAALTKEKDLSVLKTRFTSMVSHDIRTPLAVISASAEMLHGYYDRMDEATRTRHFDRIGSQVERMVELLTDVLTISRADAGAAPSIPSPSTSMPTAKRSSRSSRTTRRRSTRWFMPHPMNWCRYPPMKNCSTRP